MNELGVLTKPNLPPLKPKLRGVLHEYAFFISLGCGIALILAASDGRARVAAVIYAVAVSGLLGTSALYHRVTWRPKARRWMRRLDHSMIFVLIAGTYTPVALLALKGSLGRAILIVRVGRGARRGAVQAAVDRRPEVAVRGRVCGPRAGHRAPCSGNCRRRSAGWAWRASPPEACCTCSGRSCTRASVRIRGPGVFGYHEVFHALVVAAAALQYAVIAFAVLPHG